MDRTKLLRIMSVLESDPDGEVYDDLDHAYNMVLGYTQRRFNLSPQQVFDQMKEQRELDASVKEKLAEYAHKAWSGWMLYMFSKADLNRDGTWTMPASLVERWHRQMMTEYAELPESERVSDRKEAKEIMEIVIHHI